VQLPESGGKVVLNADHADRMSVEVSDENFKLLPDYSSDRRGKSSEQSGLDCAVSWPAGSLAALGGKTVRFRIQMNKEGSANPRLFAVYLRSE
jgi:hypothetical protein